MTADYKEKRKDPRIDIELKANFSGAAEFDNYFIGNISKGGLLIKTDQPLKIDDKFKLSFSISGIEKPFETTCKVIWIQELYDPKTDKLMPTIGCRFTEISDEDLAMIEKFITKKLTNN